MRSNERDRLIDIVRLHNQQRCRAERDTRRQFALRAGEIVAPALSGIAAVIEDYAQGLEATVRSSGGAVTLVVAESGVEQEPLHRSAAHLQPPPPGCVLMVHISLVGELVQILVNGGATPPRQLQELTAHNVTALVLSETG